MIDPEIEDLLRRYRPAGPLPDLRARIMTEAAPLGRTWPWAVAAAVLLAATLCLHVAAEDVAASADVSVATDSKQDAITLLAEMLSGVPSARALAEAAITIDTTPKEPGSRSIAPADGEKSR